jgi:hypothetical protein
MERRGLNLLNVEFVVARSPEVVRKLRRNRRILSVLFRAHEALMKIAMASVSLSAFKSSRISKFKDFTQNRKEMIIYISV